MIGLAKLLLVLVSWLNLVAGQSQPSCAIPKGQFDGMVVSTSLPMPWYGQRCASGVNYYQAIVMMCQTRYCCSSDCNCDTAIDSNTCPAGNATQMSCFVLVTMQNTTVYGCCAGNQEIDNTCIKKIDCNDGMNGGCSDECLTNATTGLSYCACQAPYKTLVNIYNCTDIAPPVAVYLVRAFPFYIIVAAVGGFLLLLLLLLILLVLCCRRKKKQKKEDEVKVEKDQPPRYSADEMKFPVFVIPMDDLKEEKNHDDVMKSTGCDDVTESSIKVLPEDATFDKTKESLKQSREKKLQNVYESMNDDGYSDVIIPSGEQTRKQSGSKKPPPPLPAPNQRTRPSGDMANRTSPVGRNSEPRGLDGKTENVYTEIPLIKQAGGGATPSGYSSSIPGFHGAAPGGTGYLPLNSGTAGEVPPGSTDSIYTEI